MGGLGVLAVIALYIFIAYVVVKSAKHRWQKAVAVVAVLLIPTADAIYGRIELKHLCEAEAGLKVYRVAEHVEGFMASTADESWIKQYGYQFSEGERAAKKFYRITRQDGQIIVEEGVVPKSQYRLRSDDFGEQEIYGHSRYLIEDITTKEILATDTQVTYHGGWAERLLAMFSDAGPGNVAWCPNRLYPEIRIQNLANSTLKH